MTKKKSKNSKFSKYDASLSRLAKDVTFAIKENKDGSDQQKQVELLMSLEEKFREQAKSYHQCREIYRKFILFVAVENRNLLSARPFFREKSKIFITSITPAIKETKITELQKFHINFNLIKFIKDNWLGDFPPELTDTYEQLVEARKRLIENNMPLAINRAKLFFRKVPESHLTLMDMIGIASQGLVSGIDKWSGEYSRVFNGVCIGRMVGNLISSYSETAIHFYPSDSSILYRANSIQSKKDCKTMEDLAIEINKSYEEDRKNGVKVPAKNIDADFLISLFNAAAPDSYDTLVNSEDEAQEILGSENPNNTEQDIIYKDLKSKMMESIKKLPNLERKVLILKGVKAGVRI